MDFDKTLTKNKKLKDEIDDLRIQRSTYDEIYKKLTRKLNDQKKLMNQIIEQSTLVCYIFVTQKTSFSMHNYNK